MITPITATFPALNFPKEVDYPTQEDWAAFSAAAELNYGILSGEWSLKAELYKNQMNTLAQQIQDIGENAINAMTFDNIAQLKLNSNMGRVDVLGYYTKGDGGGGTFYWDSTSTETDNGGTIIQATGITTGRWKRVFSGAVNAKWFGAKGDGITDDTLAIQKMHLVSNNVFYPKGTYIINSYSTINGYKAIVSITTNDFYISAEKGAKLKSTVALDCFYLIGKGTTYGVSKSIIENISFDCNGLSLRAILAENTTGESALNTSTIRDVYVYRSMYAGMEIDGFKNIFSNVFIQEGTGYGIYLGGILGSKQTTSTILQSCYVSGNAITEAYKSGIITYSKFISCACDGTADVVFNLGYAQSVSIDSCGTEGALKFFYGTAINLEICNCFGSPIGSNNAGSPNYLIELYRFERIILSNNKFTTTGRYVTKTVRVVNVSDAGNASELRLLDNSINRSDILISKLNPSGLSWIFKDIDRDSTKTTSVTDSVTLNAAIVDAIINDYYENIINIAAGTYIIDLNTATGQNAIKPFTNTGKKIKLVGAGNPILYYNNTITDVIQFNGFDDITAYGIIFKTAGTDGARRILGFINCPRVVLDTCVFDGNSAQISNLGYLRNSSITLKNCSTQNIPSYSYAYAKGFDPDAYSDIVLSKFTTISNGFGSAGLTTILTTGLVKYWNDTTNAWV